MAIFRCDAFPKGPRTEKTPSRGKILPPCIQNELVLARYVLHVFKMPCKAPFGNTSRGYLAIKTPFSRPNPSNHAQWASIATLFRLVFRVGALRFLSAWELGARPALRFVLHCGISCSLREGASAVAGGASAAVRPLRGGVGAVICPFRGDASTATKKRVQPKGPFWVRSSCNAFLSGKSWQYFVAAHSRRGATGRGTPSQIRRRLRGR